MKKYVSEFTGTALYVLMGCGSAVIANLMFNALGITLPLAYTNLLIALVFGLTFMALWFFLNHVSGCHLNPAVSFAKLITKKITVKDFIGYIVAQFAGGFAGAALLIVIIGGRFSFYANQYGMGSVLGTKPGTAFLIEVILTFILVSVFLKVTEKEEGTAFQGVAIGLTLIAVNIFGAPFTGTSVNPARSLGTGILQGGEAMTQSWLFVVAPLAGALLAALFYQFINRPEKKEIIAEELTEEPAEELTEEAAEELAEEAGEELAEEAGEAGTEQTAEETVTEEREEIPHEPVEVQEEKIKDEAENTEEIK